jgi:6-phosphogluconolactonase (cycloisomerase 2 family)
LGDSAGRRGVRWTVALVAGLAAFTATAAEAGAKAGKLTFRDCVTTETASGPVPAGTGACVAEGPGLSTNGTLSGLDNPESVAVSPNGRSLYAVSRPSDSLVRYKRDTDTGKLDYQYCFTGDTQVTIAGCEAISEATSGGSGSGLDGPEAVTVAPDGKSVYVTSRFDDSVFAFSREPNGFITPIGCVSGDTNTGNLGTGACTTIPSATGGGDNSGLNDPKLKEVAISSDGEWLYAAGDLDDSVATFSRNPSTSVLSYQGCVTGEVETGPAGTNACATTTDQVGLNGQYSGLDGPRWVELSRDGRSLYVAADGDDAVARLSRNRNTGAVAWDTCVSGNTQTGPAGSGACSLLPDATDGGSDSGIELPRALTLNAGHLYAVGANDASVVHFRIKNSGRLGFVRCITGSNLAGPGGSGACAAIRTASANGNGSGLDAIRDLEIKGRNLYTAAQGDDAIATFVRKQDTGRVRFQRCVTGSTDLGPTGNGACAQIPSATAGGLNSGMDGLETIALSREGASLYGAAEQDDAIARFKRTRR